MKAKLVNVKGNMLVDIDGKLFPFAAQRSFRPQREILGDFCDHGLRFFNVFPSGIMTALVQRTVCYSEYGAVWTGIGQYNWDALRRQCDEFFASIGDDCYISLACHLDPPQWYVDTHPGYVDHWEQFHNNVGDDQWKKDAADYMCALIDKVDEWFPDRVYAVMLFCGGTTEWYSYHWDKIVGQPTEIQKKAYRKYIGDENAPFPTPEIIHGAEDGFLRHPEKNAAAVRYWEFINDITSDAQLYFAKVAREHTKGSKLICLFNAHTFGQHVDATVRTSYNNLDRLLQSPDIDVIMAPASYTLRTLASTSSIRTGVDSITAYGKLYIHEIDSSTNLPPKKARSAGDDAAVHQHAVGRDENFRNVMDAAMYMRREAGLAISKGQGYWWFDMFGGYYDEPVIMNEVRSIHELQEKLVGTDCTSVSEAVTFLDKRSNLYVKTASFYPIRADIQNEAINNCACPSDQCDTFVLFKDGFDAEKYKLFFFPVLVAPDRKLRDKIADLRSKGKNMLWLHAPGFVTENGYSTDAMEELTGIRFRRETLCTNRIRGVGKFEGISFNMQNSTVNADIWRNDGEVIEVSPVFSCENLDEVFAVYEENGRPAAGIRYREDGGFDAYFGLGPIPYEFVSEIYERAKIFRYADGKTPVYANNGFECVYGRDGGEITLYRPDPCVLTDHSTGESFKVGPEGTKVPFDLHQTRLFTVRHVKE